MNKGVFDGTREYDQYMMLYRDLWTNVRKIIARCRDNYEFYELYNLTTKEVIKSYCKRTRYVKGNNELRATGNK